MSLWQVSGFGFTTTSSVSADSTINIRVQNSGENTSQQIFLAQVGVPMGNWLHVWPRNELQPGVVLRYNVTNAMALAIISHNGTVAEYDEPLSVKDTGTFETLEFRRGRTLDVFVSPF